METVKIYKKNLNLCVKDAQSIYNEMKDIKDNEQELFVMFSLDSKNRIIARNIITIGTLNSTLIHPRDIFRIAILHNANTFIVAHNHPSGDSTPSEEDKEITKRIKESGEILGIKLLDHIIVGDVNIDRIGYTSLRDYIDF